MAFRVFLIGFPFLIMIVSVVLGGGNLTSNGSQQNITFCNSNGCGAAVGGSSVITCTTSSVVPCKIAPNCITPTPTPAWCFPWPFSLIPTNAGTFLNPGATVVLTSSQIQQGLNSNAAIFGFGAISTSGWIIVILVAVGVAILASLQVFGSGLSPEAIHILFIAGTILGIWAFLTGFDGFLSGNPNSLFAQLNVISIQGAAIGLGTTIYVMLTFLLTVGVISMIQRGV